mgnify:CR=1 FL=1
MGLSLKERMAKASADKELRRAHKAAVRSDLDGRSMVKAFRSQSRGLDLIAMDKAVGVFAGDDPAAFDRLMADRRYRLLFQTVREQLTGEWLQRFRGLLAAIPLQRRMLANRFEWEEWLEYGRMAGFDEAQTVEALRVIYIFMDRSRK